MAFLINFYKSKISIACANVAGLGFLDPLNMRQSTEISDSPNKATGLGTKGVLEGVQGHLSFILIRKVTLAPVLSGQNKRSESASSGPDGHEARPPDVPAAENLETKRVSDVSHKSAARRPQPGFRSQEPPARNRNFLSQVISARNPQPRARTPQPRVRSQNFSAGNPQPASCLQPICLGPRCSHYSCVCTFRPRVQTSSAVAACNNGVNL